MLGVSREHPRREVAEAVPKVETTLWCDTPTGAWGEHLPGPVKGACGASGQQHGTSWVMPWIRVLRRVCASSVLARSFARSPDELAGRSVEGQ